MTEPRKTALSLTLRNKTDIGYARQRSREIGEVLRLSQQACTRLATAVSELARNALVYAGGGKVEYVLQTGPRPELIVRIIDQGPGIDDLDAVLAGASQATNGLGIGLHSAAKLADRLDIDTSPEGTVAELAMRLDRGADGLDQAAVDRVIGELMARSPDDPMLELQRQNHELLRALEQLRLAQERLAHANDERDGLLELVPSIVVRMREGGHVDYLNPQWTHYTGMTLEDSRGHGWHQAIHPDERPVGVEWWHQAVESEHPVEVEWRLCRADGEYRWHVFRAVSLRGGPEPVWYGSMTDIHDTRERASEAARIAQFRERMVGVVSHDLRSPLSAIMLATELLHLQGLDEPATKTVRRISSCGSRALRMISTLLDYTSSHLGGGIPVEPEFQDLTSLVNDIVNENRAQHSDRTIVVEGDGAAIRAEVDHDRIAQALGNLLGNAIAHGSATDPIVVALSSDDDTVTVEVRNRGEVIPPERVARLFEPFQRGDERGSRRGFGLGLYIVREIARAHGGRAELTSTAQDGTIARLTLPLLAGPNGRRGESEPDAPTPSRGIARL